MYNMLLLFTNRKLHTGFRLVLKVVILNDLERRDSRLPILRYFTQFGSFVTYNVTVVEVKPYYLRQ